MTITVANIISAASRNGITVNPAAVQMALSAIDQDAELATQRARVTYVSWDGKGNPPVGTPERWTHGQDALSKFAINAFAHGGVVYFMLLDGELLYWQPRPPTDAIIMTDTPTDSAYWQNHASKHADTHAQMLAGQSVVEKVYTALGI